MTKWYAAALVVAIGLAAAVIAQWPEIHRYLKMERM
jgi:hypothetical protein